MSIVEEFEQRQAEIDGLLTASIIQRIVLEHSDEIFETVNSDKSKRFVNIVYGSTKAVHRLVTGQEHEKPVYIEYRNIDEVLEKISNNTLLTCKKLDKSVCICISSYINIDNVYTHSYTCINNILN